MGKWTDKDYITQSEWATIFGGARANYGALDQIRKGEFRRLPYNFCALTLVPFVNPLCTREGIIFDRESITKYALKLKEKNLPLLNPVNGTLLKLESLIPLNFQSSPSGSTGEFICPITKKVFNDSSYIVALAVTGNVYSFEAVQKLCFETRNYFDLVDPTVPFLKNFTSEGGDVIVIQDPTSLDSRNLNTFQHLQDPSITNIQSSKPFLGQNSLARAKSNVANRSGILKKVLEELKGKEKNVLKESERLGLTSSQLSFVYHNQSVDHPSSTLPYSRFSTNPGNPKTLPKVSSVISDGKMAASLTSSIISPCTKSLSHLDSAEDSLIHSVKENGYVVIVTSLGNLNLELFTKYAPRTVYNFIGLASGELLNNTIFHRNVSGFMIQGGDPTGTGTGGKSVFKDRYFEDEIVAANVLSHNKRGILSMANHGPNTNSSQFFITYGSCPHLDGKHTIFGRVVGGFNTLEAMEQMANKSGTMSTDTMIELIRFDIKENPFEYNDKKTAETRDRAVTVNPQTKTKPPVKRRPLSPTDKSLTSSCLASIGSLEKSPKQQKYGNFADW